MKFFIVAVLIFAICGVAMAGPSPEKKAFMKACQEENKASDQDMADLQSGKNVSQAGKCVSKCVMEKMGVMDPATGQFLPDRMKEKFTDIPNIADSVEKCKGQKGANPCDTAFMISDCVMKNGPKV